MPAPPRDQVESVLSEIIREALKSRQPIRVPGLGHFEVLHKASERATGANGEVRLVPPRDEIVFSPEE